MNSPTPNPLGHNPFDPGPKHAGPVGGAPAYPQARGNEVNTLATSATVQAIAANANVVVDVFLQTKDADSDRTLTVIKSIIAKIPG